ncbi:MAG: leucine-rich repeat domain-containing protein [archaeon]
MNKRGLTPIVIGIIVVVAIVVIGGGVMLFSGGGDDRGNAPSGGDNNIDDGGDDDYIGVGTAEDTCLNDKYTALRHNYVFNWVGLEEMDGGEFNRDVHARGDVALNDIADLTCLEYLDINSGCTGCTKLTDISVLSDLPNLKIVILVKNEISDLSPLANLPIKELNVNYNKIRDISVLANFKELTNVNIKGNEISDLSPLYGLDKLETVEVTEADGTGNSVTEAQCDELESELTALGNGGVLQCHGIRYY